MVVGARFGRRGPTSQDDDGRGYPRDPLVATPPRVRQSPSPEEDEVVEGDEQRRRDVLAVGTYSHGLVGQAHRSSQIPAGSPSTVTPTDH